MADPRMPDLDDGSTGPRWPVDEERAERERRLGMMTGVTGMFFLLSAGLEWVAGSPDVEPGATIVAGVALLVLAISLLAPGSAARRTEVQLVAVTLTLASAAFFLAETIL